ncbi:hypothetical protein [Mesorhizobium sp. LSHC440A00]|uniref:hypothetical protein n=1 Tax=Mesorhizobium sp. LSHC440A00 TaxID=1287307 RepID=UPI00067EBF92|nr:hypothetical protein [Mesorhizobium sp. LSHC440A00]
MLLLQQLLHVAHAVAAELLAADAGAARQVGMIGADAVGQARPQIVDAHQVALAEFAARNRRRLSLRLQAAMGFGVRHIGRFQRLVGRQLGVVVGRRLEILAAAVVFIGGLFGWFWAHDAGSCCRAHDTPSRHAIATVAVKIGGLCKRL